MILVLVPGHKEDPNPDSVVNTLARKLLDCSHQQEKPAPFQGQLLLIRTRTVLKAATIQGPRTKDTHWGTIEVGPNSPDCSGKVVVILDVTSGLRVAQSKCVLSCQGQVSQGKGHQAICHWKDSFMLLNCVC